MVLKQRVSLVFDLRNSDILSPIISPKPGASQVRTIAVLDEAIWETPLSTSVSPCVFGVRTVGHSSVAL